MALQKGIIFSVAGLCASICLAQSKTMFIPRLITTDQIFELSGTNYQFHKNKKTINSVLVFKPFYQNSHAEKNLAKFFLPGNKTCSAVRENGTGDINSLWLNLISSYNTFYSSTLSLQPQRTSAGMVLTWYADFHPYIPHLWMGLNTSVVHTRHNLHVREQNRTNLGTLPGFATLYQALNNPEWSAGRLCCGSQSSVALDDIQLKLGYDCIENISMRISPYLVGTIPTGNRPNARYLFEPLVGSKHGSLGFGLNMDFSLHSCWSFMMDAKYSYVFASHERRSFDLHNSDWSRYLLVVTQAEPYFTYPGINSFTKTVRVTPGSTFQLWSAFHYECDAWQIEMGYNLWLRGKEKISMRNCAVALPSAATPIGIFDMQVGNLPVTTAHTAMIQQGIVGPNPVVSDAAFTALTSGDLNKSSARNAKAVSNTLYGSCGYQFDCVPLVLALNGSYEFTRSCGAIPQYAIWGSVAVQF